MTASGLVEAVARPCGNGEAQWRRLGGIGVLLELSVAQAAG